MQALGWIIPNASSWVNNTKCHIHVLARLMYSRHSLELFDEWCQNHGEIPYSHHSLELGHCQDDGEILYSGHSLATMRTVQNSKTLAGNISMLYHWLWVTVGLWDYMYKSTTYSKNFCRVSSKYSQSVIIGNYISKHAFIQWCCEMMQNENCLSLTVEIKAAFIFKA